MASAGNSGQPAVKVARQAADSRWIERTARVGLAARGLVYGLIGILAFQIAFVDCAKHADQQGAFQSLAQNGVGKALLWLVIIGFVGYGSFGLRRPPGTSSWAVSIGRKSSSRGV